MRELYLIGVKIAKGDDFQLSTICRQLESRRGIFYTPPGAQQYVKSPPCSGLANDLKKPKQPKY